MKASPKEQSTESAVAWSGFKMHESQRGRGRRGGGGEGLGGASVPAVVLKNLDWVVSLVNWRVETISLPATRLSRKCRYSAVLTRQTTETTVIPISIIVTVKIQID